VGFAKLLRWVGSQVPKARGHFCLEATGAYSQALAQFLAEADQTVSVVNPAWIKYAGMSQGHRNKTDQADARLIADYCRKEQPAPWRMSAPEVRTLLALVRRLESVQGMLQQEKNRLSVPALIPSVQRSLQESIQFLEAEIARLQQQIDDHITGHPTLKADQELLLSIPGIGQTLSQWLLAELPDVGQFSCAQAVGAYAGLNPRECRSGTSIQRPTRLSKAGNARLRKALYMPALVAIRFNPPIKARFARLVQKGLKPKAALCAAMRKLLMIAYGVLKSRQMFTLQPVEETP
jgi:transposase